MPLNHYVTLGRSGLRVSPLCLGTMTFGEDWGWGCSVKDAEAILDRYAERGGNFIDTANAYTKGHSEKIIGDHIGRHAGRRDRFVLATKFFVNMHLGDPNGGGAGRKALIRSCDESLRRLQTDYIDLFWMHAWDRHTPIEETMAALDTLVSAGKIRYIGFSDTPAWKVAQAQTIAMLRGWSPLIALQIEYSLLERTVEGELIPMAQELGLGVTPWGPLRAGVLSGKYTTGEAATQQSTSRGAPLKSVNNDRTKKLIDAIAMIASQLGTTPARVALAWVQTQPGVTSTILGVRTVAQLDDNVASLDVSLSAEHRKLLDELTRPTLNFPASFLARSGAITNGGTVINGDATPAWPLIPQNDKERW